MVKHLPDETGKKAANSVRALKRQIESGSDRVMSSEKKLNKLLKSGGGNANKRAKKVTDSLERTSTVREHLLADLGNLASAFESGRERDIETGKKRVQQSHKALADAVNRLDRSIKSGQREGTPGGAAGHGDKPDIEELVREIYDELLRQLEMARQRTEDPWL